ncbi:hypothetical protein HETIRDRAFT_115355 [Heterobasidion irregulare TC 32-1]|uniref:C2H2-type domain-containing protein n=1 Tax=Heterobasidion irregulare (strain TC 32-1) TaxID=747525 RepID=W4KJV3_HETIT|nr:uncharacterized protein HETIRDRAFT_115355 [Heterobasidion irregulare TC 32-1]ETW85311.1 hypothetical protein HETIRDRAFT_115355 [Heterobasidion irregulare TC 32-1]
MSDYYSDNSFDDELSSALYICPSCSQPYVDETHDENGHTDKSDEDVHLPQVRGASIQPWPYAYIAHGGHHSPYAPLTHPSLPETDLEVPASFAQRAPARAIQWDDNNQMACPWPFLVPLPATHTYTEAATHYIPTSTFLTLAHPIEVKEHPLMRCAAPFSSILDAVYPIQGQWRDMAWKIVEAPCNIILRVLAKVLPWMPIEEVPKPIPELPPSPETASVPVPQEHYIDMEEGPRWNKAKERKGSEGEGQGGSQGGNGAKAERHIAAEPLCGERKRDGGAQSQIHVVHPQAYHSAPKDTTFTSMTSTHRVEIPIGKPVPKAVPQSIGGPWTTTPGEEQRGVQKHKRADPHICDGPDGCSKWLFCPYDMPRHKVTLHHGEVHKFACNDCPALFVRKDEVLRHMREHCPNRGRKHNSGGSPSQGPRHDGLEGGGGGMGGLVVVDPLGIARQMGNRSLYKPSCLPPGVLIASSTSSTMAPQGQASGPLRRKLKKVVFHKVDHFYHGNFLSDETNKVLNSAKHLCRVPPPPGEHNVDVNNQLNLH